MRLEECIQAAGEPVRSVNRNSVSHAQGVTAPSNNPKYFSRKQAANEFGVSDQFISKLIKSGKLRAFKLGRIVRIERHDLLSILKESK
jgi:excisionase family DNA binding protein